MKLLKPFLFFIALISYTGVHSQDMKINATVFDSTGSVPLENAVAMAIRLKDSLLLGFARSNKNGEVQLSGFPLDTFSLIFEHPNFDDKTYFIFGNESNFEITIPSVIMPPKAQHIEEVVIYAYREPIYFKGDTLVYVADSFKVDEHAVVEDLLKKLPGIEVDKDGKIKSQGQDIAKVLVDGDEFFGTDPTVATKNLGANGIESVQIYEKENEDGSDTDEKIKVLDLILKDDAKKGYFGRVSAGSDLTLTPVNGELGTNPFYEGELLLNKFNNKQKVSVFVLGSNTPKSAFGWGDLNKFGLENESGSAQNFWEYSDRNSSGIPQTFKTGIYFNDKIGKKKNTLIGFNYSYNNVALDAVSASSSQYFLSDTTYYTDDSTRNYSKNESHKINLKFESQFDSLTKLTLRPSFSFDKGIQDNSDISKFSGEDRIQSLETNVFNSTDSKGYSFNNELLFNRKFKKKNRELDLIYYLTNSDNTTDAGLFSTSVYSLGTQVNDTTDQKKFYDNSSMNHYSVLTYTEPIIGKWLMEFEYLNEYEISRQNKETYDLENGAYSLFNTGLSNNFETIRFQNRGGTRLIFKSRKYTISAGVRFRNIDIDNFNVISGVRVNQNINNVLPNAQFVYNPSISKRLNIFYETSSSQPSINDIQPVQDNTNPNRIQVGNQNLIPSYTHQFRLNFNTWKAMTGQYVWTGGFLRVTDNAFANSVSYDSYGRTISQTVNVNGNLNSSIWAGAGFPVYKKIIEVAPELDASYFHYTNIVENQNNITDNMNIGGGLEITFEWDSLEIDLGNKYTQGITKSSLSSYSNSSYSTQEYSLGFEWKLRGGFKFETDATYTINGQRTAGYNIDYLVWNAEISKNLLKTQNLRVSLIGNDLLNQNINALREINGNIITDNRTQIISRYFLLKVTLRFNSNKTKEEDFRGWH